MVNLLMHFQSSWALNILDVLDYMDRGLQRLVQKKKRTVTLNKTNDVVQQMQERMQKMEKQMEEHRITMRQEVITNVVAQLQYAGLIDPSILTALSFPSLAEATSAQPADQGDEIEGDESDSEDLT